MKYKVQFRAGTLQDGMPLKRSWIAIEANSPQDAAIEAIKPRIPRYEKVSRTIVAHVHGESMPKHANGMPMMCHSFEMNIEASHN